MQTQDRNSGTDRRVWLGGALIVIGALFFLSSFDFIHFNFGRILFSWQFIMLVIGLFILVNSNKKVLGGILAGIGGLFLIPKLFPQVHFGGEIFWAIVLISLGVYIIAHHRKNGDDIDDQTLKKDYVDDVAIFGGGTKIFSSDNFKGGNITAVFGGSDINLTACKLAPGNNTIDVLAIFGGSTIIVPHDWNIVVNVTSILGGFSNKSVKNPSVVTDNSKTLIIKGLVIFGGGEIKTFY